MSGTPCFQHDSYQRDCSDCWHDEPATPPQPAPAQAGVEAQGVEHIPVNAVGAGGLAGPSYCAKCGVSLPEGASRECSPEREAQPVSTGATEASDAVERVRDAMISTLILIGSSLSVADVDALAQAAIAALKGGGDNANNG